MTLVDEAGLPGGRELIMNWIGRLHGDRPDRFLWEVLDDRLRLALAQGWVLGTVGVRNDDLAEDLAAEDCDGPGFERMLEWLVQHWRSVYVGLRNGFGWYNQPILVGAGMELVIVTGPEYFGPVVAGQKAKGHCFVTRLDADDWLIAALARRLPVPGWPPTEESIPGLGIDG